MIITRTPLRISFAGGGTDLPSFYRQYGGGAVTAAAIDRYVHVLVNEKFDKSIRVAYSRTENVDHVGDIQHELVREAMRIAGLSDSLEIHTIADIPGEGTGLGSSSTLTVGLLNALAAYKGELKDQAQLAEEAFHIEFDRLGGTLGKQDHYVAAFGGVQYLEFRPNDTVRVAPIPLSREQREELGDRMSLFYTGTTRRASPILKQQSARTAMNQSTLETMRELATDARDAIVTRSWERLGGVLDEGWQLKRGLSEGISNETIDRMYAAARRAGAWGGKIAGAGGGGFLMLLHPPERAHEIAEALSPMRHLSVRIAPEGTQIIFYAR
jgi:D-glycero-alpha-D-manno-heptose-7-phosphate kinase